MSKRRFFVVIAAAGQGNRMKSSVSKQFLELDGIPIIIRTLKAFEAQDKIEGVLVVAKEDEISLMKDLCEKHEVSKILDFVVGGETRQDSVRNALTRLAYMLNDDKECKKTFDFDSINGCYVLIHDGARPFVSSKIINDCMDCVVKHNSCAVGVKIKDTVKEVSISNQIIKTVNRDKLWAIQTPQAFYLSLVLSLHEKAKKENISFTDDTSLFEHYGKESFMIEGDYKNIKITTPEDLVFGEAILKEI